MGKKVILVVFGTRPEAIKMAPVIKELKESFEVFICVTGQHREMLDQVLEVFNIRPDYDLNLMKRDQDLFDLTKNILLKVKKVIEKISPNLILVHGDTTTAMVTSIAAFYLKIPLGHVEAGLRTKNLYSPFPEEFNRQIISKSTSLNFAPTEIAKRNLLDEGIKEDSIFVTGNTVIDALLEVSKDIDFHEFSSEVLNQCSFLKESSSKKIILVTGHRRENFGKGFQEICNGFLKLADRTDIQIIYPVHLNPNVKSIVLELLSSKENINLINPLGYLDFVKLMKMSKIIITDSGGIQEEAPSLGKPVLVVRDTTERPEGINSGNLKLVGANSERIVSEVNNLLDNNEEYRKMATSINPFGDGKASSRISEAIKKYFS